jgi:mono/diheme cytochrome c family protein
MRRAFGILVVLAVYAGGCGGGGGGAADDTTAGGESAYAGPIGSTDVATGQQQFEAVCAGCHNAGAPQLANIGWTPERMRQQIREGSGQMPAIRENRLSAADMESVLAYMATIGAVSDGTAGATPAGDTTAAEGDAAATE